LYIYRLATGRPITESRRILNQAVGAYPEWKEISWGLQEILRRLLHPNPSARVGDELLSLDSAEKIAQEFRNLDEYWKETPDELIADIRRSVDAAQKANPEKEIEDQTRHYRLARTALEIASKRGIQIKEYDERLQRTVVEESDYYTRARNLYEGTSYAPARKLFQIGARLLSSSKLRRWAWLAYAGELAREKNYSGVKDLAEQAVELMEQEQFQDAGVSLDTAMKTLPSEALRTLREECEALNLVQQAIIAQRDGEYKSAEGAYRSAHGIWIKTDDHDEWKDKVGDLLGQAGIVHRQGENQEKVNASLKKIEMATELTIILDELQKALELDLGNQAVYALADKLAGERFNSGLLEDAAQILWGCGIAPAAPPEALDWRYPDEIRLALSTLRQLDSELPYVPLIRHDKNALPYKLAVKLFEKNFIRPADMIGLERVERIAELMSALDAALGEKMKEKIQVWREEMDKADKEKVNRLIANASSLMFTDARGALQNLPMPQVFARLQNRLGDIEDALEFLDQASCLAGSEDKALKSKIEELRQRGVAMKNEFSQSLSENQKQKEEAIAVLKGKAEEIWAQWEQLNDVFPKLAGMPAQVSDSVSGLQAERLGKINELCAQILDLESENRWALQTQQKVNGLIQGLGDYAALAVVSQKNVINAAVDVLLHEADDFYKDGKTLDAARSLRKVEALNTQDASLQKRFTELRAKVTALMGITYWEQENKTKLEEGEFDLQLLERIATHFSPEIPPQFRGNSASLEYLFAARQKLFTQLLKINPVNNSPEFAETLRNLVWTDNLYRRGMAWQKRQIVDQKTEKWNSAKFARNVLRAYKKGNLSQEMEKLLVGLLVFADPESRSAQLIPEVTHLIPEIFKPKPQHAWPKWALAGGSLAVIGILAMLAIWNGDVLASIIGMTPPTATVAPVVVVVPTETPTPILIPTYTPTSTEAPTITPVEVLAVPNCITANGKIRSNADAAAQLVFTMTKAVCLLFDGSASDGDFTFYRIAAGQKIGEWDAGGCWVGTNFLTTKDPTPPSVSTLTTTCSLPTTPAP